MKFKIGDLVEITNKDLVTYGLVGKVIEIDNEWVYPYEIEFLDKEAKDKYDETLFGDYDLTLFEEEEEKSGHLIKTFISPNDFINITFQEGTVEENGVNGAQIEDVIYVLVERLESFQKGGFPCRENALAITKLEEARMWLNERTRRRIEQGVEGKHEKHE